MKTIAHHPVRSIATRRPSPAERWPGAVKVPEIRLHFWICTLTATALGQAGGNALSASIGLDYLLGALLLSALYVGAVAAQIKATQFQPTLYWATMLAAAMLGKAVVEMAVHWSAMGYAGTAALLAMLLLGTLAAWWRATGSVAVDNVRTPLDESHYWLAILLAQCLGTVLDDGAGATLALGPAGVTHVVAGLLLLLMLIYVKTRIPATLVFWVAFVLTRPLGGALGDHLYGPLEQGAQRFSQLAASVALVALFGICVLRFDHRAARPGEH